MVLKNKEARYSKTKIGALLIGISLIIGSIGDYLSGNVGLGAAIEKVLMEVGGILSIFGIRDIPILNKG